MRSQSASRVKGASRSFELLLLLVSLISMYPRLLTPRSISQKLVELIAALQTSKETLARAKLFAEACGKGKFWLSILLLVRCIHTHLP